MASPIQMVIGKGIPNPLIVEGLLKILRDLCRLSKNHWRQVIK